MTAEKTVLSALAVAVVASLHAAALPVPERNGVTAPEAARAHSTRRHEGIPSIEASPKCGRLWATWYASPTPGEDSNNYIVLATSADGGRTWKEVLHADPDGAGPLRYFDPELWISPDGKLRWFFAERTCKQPAGWYTNPYTADIGDEKTDRLMMVTLGAEAEPEAPFQQAVEVVGVKGVMMCKPTVLKDGTWVLPVSQWFAAPSSCVFASTDDGKTFAMRGGATLPKNRREYDEHMLIEMNDGSLACWSRAKGGPMMAVSRDGGKTWGAPVNNPVGHPNSRLFIRRLASGNLLLVKHGKMGEQPKGGGWLPRKELRAFISRDDGKTWEGDLLLDDRPGVSYPDGSQLQDGMIVVTYDRDRLKAREIMFAAFAESDVLSSKPMSEKCRLREIISSAGAVVGRRGYKAPYPGSNGAREKAELNDSK